MSCEYEGMLAFLEGIVVDKSPSEVLVNVSGMGFSVQIPFDTFRFIPEAGKKVFLWVYTYIGEKEIKLFGFKDREQLDLFKTIISIPKVGPNVALSIISHLSHERFFEIVDSGDISALKAIPKVGEKTAKRIISELKGVIPSKTFSSKEGDVLSALKSLGYTDEEAVKALRMVENKESLSEDELLKECLKILGDMK